MFDQVLDNFKVKLNEQREALLFAFCESAKWVDKMCIKDIYIWAVDYDFEGSICLGFNLMSQLSENNLKILKERKIKLVKFREPTSDIFYTGDWKYQDLSNKDIDIDNIVEKLRDVIRIDSDILYELWMGEDTPENAELYYSYNEKMKYIFQEFCFSVREEAIQKNELCREYMDNRLFFVIEHEDSLEEAIDRNYIKTGRIVV
ncbi:MAG: hypothetical protein I8H74_01220 [Moraxellaceae bacterium]|nr:hypothetical protein [Moraxellaceae bacterium]